MTAPKLATRACIGSLRTAILVLLAAGLLDCGSRSDTLPTKPPAGDADTTAEHLLGGVQEATWATFELSQALLPAVFAQQISGVDRQWNSYALYVPTAVQSGVETERLFQAFYNLSAFESFSRTYRVDADGGLKYVRQMRAAYAAKAPAQPIGVGIAQVYEALLMGTAADWFGDVPYSRADTTPNGDVPFDGQGAVYAHVLALLDSALVNLASGGSFTGPDAVYGGNAAAWIRMAHTLKARINLHASRFSDSTARFQAALSEAELGISTPAGTYEAKHGSGSTVNLIWGSIGVGGDRGNDVSTPGGMIEIMKARVDANALALDFTKVDSAGTSTYVGTPPTTRTLPPGVSNPSNFRMTSSSPVPIVTYAENQLILAEARYRTGDVVAALETLNAERATLGEPAIDASGVTILEEILTEKYVQGFLTSEPWLGYLRTCWPNLALPPNAALGYVPGRLWVAQSVIQNNPNTPVQHVVNAATPRREKSLDWQYCSGQRNRPE